MKQPVKQLVVGIVGEHPTNDAQALLHLLKPVARENIKFVVMQKNNRGSQLDSAKFPRILRAEFIAEKPDYIILVRDLDGLITESEKVRVRDAWFSSANHAIDNNGIFFLAVYEMEALLLSDSANFNKYYRLTIAKTANPMLVERPKEYIQRLTKKTQKGKYSEHDTSKIMQSLDFKTIYKTHTGDRSFQQFADELFRKELIYLVE